MNTRKTNVVENLIPYFPLGQDFSAYYSIVMEDFQNVKSYFPLLQITSLPTIKSKEIFITGSLIPVDVLKGCLTPQDIERNSIYILGIYPCEYPLDNIYVEDLHQKINWSKVPYEHRHQNIYPKNNRIILCTHHPYGEINGLKQSDRTIAILSSAWKLYMQYKEFLKTENWILKDLRHGYEGILQLKKIGRYYGK